MPALKFSLMVSLCLMAVSAFAQDLPELAFEKYTLDNGLEVILHQDSTIPMVSVNVWYHVGSKNEKPGRTGCHDCVIAVDISFHGTVGVGVDAILNLQVLDAGDPADHGATLSVHQAARRGNGKRMGKAQKDGRICE